MHEINMTFIFVSFLGPITVIALWFFLTSSGVVKPLYFPTLQSVGLSFFELKDTLLLHVVATVSRIIIGYITGVGVGIIAGMIMKYNDFLYKYFNPIVESWRPVPPVALVPFFILWFGFSDLGKIILVLLGIALVMIVSILEAIEQVNPIYIRSAYSLGSTKQRVFLKVILPAIIPTLRSGLRVSLALSIALVVVSEFLGADHGIGYLINISKVTFNTPAIVLGIIILGIIAFVLDAILQLVLSRLTLWNETYSESFQ